MNEFLHMGGYGAYVWSAYGLSLLVLGFNILAVRIRNQNVRREVQEFLSREQ